MFYDLQTLLLRPLHQPLTSQSLMAFQVHASQKSWWEGIIAGILPVITNNKLQEISDQEKQTLDSIIQTCPSINTRHQLVRAKLQ